MAARTPVVQSPSGYDLPDSQRRALRWTLYIGYAALIAGVMPVPEVQAASGVTRESGANRFATAADISKKNFAPGVPVVYIANGLTGLVDALAAGPSAAKQGGPTLLVTTSSIPAETRAELTRLKPAKIVIAGGTSVVSTSVGSGTTGVPGGTMPTIGVLSSPPIPVSCSRVRFISRLPERSSAE